MPSTPHSLSAAQRAFIEGAEALGATAPPGARALPELSLLSRRELDELVELGLVREAADSRYYVFRPRRAIAAAPPAPAASRAGLRIRGPYLRTILFWLIVILIPILLNLLTSLR